MIVANEPILDDVEAIPQMVALRLQLAMIAGREPGDRFWEIRELPSGRQTWLPTSEVHAACAAIQSAGAKGDVYVGALPRLKRSGTAAAVGSAACLWVDLDSPEATRRLASFRPQPTMVIRSGSAGCRHAWWALHEPIKAEWAPRANKRLALALGGDPVSTDAARIMRPAGTLNFKHNPPRPVVCTRLETHVFTLDQVVGGLPDPTPPATFRRPTPNFPKTYREVGDRLEPLVRTVRESLPGTRNARLFWAACRAAEHVAAGELDGGDGEEALLEAGLSVGLPEFEILRTIASAQSAGRRLAA